jgi:hypothetical protein
MLPVIVARIHSILVSAYLDKQLAVWLRLCGAVVHADKRKSQIRGIWLTFVCNGRFCVVEVWMEGGRLRIKDMIRTAHCQGTQLETLDRECADVVTISPIPCPFSFASCAAVHLPTKIHPSRDTV